MSMESIYKLSVLVNLVDRFSGPLTTVQRAASNTTQEMANYSQKAVASTKDSASLVAAGAGLATAVIAPTKATFATQDALAELSSLGIQDLGKLESVAEQFSNTWAGTTKPEFLTAAYDIKSGIASLSDQGVADMTRIAGVTAKATKATITEMTSLFATGYSIYKDYYGSLSDLEFGELFSAGIAKSVQQFKTTGSGMAQAISALGQSATNAGAPLEEHLAILGMLQATMSGSEAGTKYTAFLQNAARAGNELGLSFTDANGQLKSMPEILNAIRGKFGDVMTAADKLELQKAFGTIEAVKLIDLLYGKTDDLQSNILSLYDTMGQGISVAGEMANRINAPPGQGWILLKQQWQAVVELAGNSMLPTLSLMQQQLMPLLATVADFVRANPELVSGVLYAVGAIGIFISSLGLLKGAMALINIAISSGHSIITGLSKGWKLLTDGWDYARIAAMMLGDKLTPLKSGFISMAGGVKTATLGMLTWVKQGIMSAVGALPGLIAGVWSFTAALLANPITWVVVGIVALIAALVLLWKNWDSVSAWISGTWDAVCSGVAAGLEWIKNGIGGIVAWFGEKLAAFRDFGANILNGITEGIMSVASKPIEAVKGVFTAIRNMLPFSDAKTGPLSDLTLSGQRVFETLNGGMMDTAGLPAQTVESAFAGMDDAFPVGGGFAPMADAVPQDRGVTINRLELKVDISSIESLKKLQDLILELEDGVNSNRALTTGWS